MADNDFNAPLLRQNDDFEDLEENLRNQPDSESDNRTF